MDRRKFLRNLGFAALGSSTAGGLIYPFLEAKWLRIVRRTIAVPNLAAPFRGTTVAVLADIHHGPFVPLAYIRHVVATTNALKPDIIALVGDYVHRHETYIAPGIDELGKLQAALGRFAVRGNHDNRNFQRITRAALAEAKLPDLNNTGVWIERGGARCGSAASVISGLTGKISTPHLAMRQNTMPRSFSRTTPTTSRRFAIRRVSLVLSGHTHGGQIVLPG